jgi:hypothetical protein
MKWNIYYKSKRGKPLMSCYSWKVGYDDRLVRSLKIDVEVENQIDMVIYYRLKGSLI